MEGGSRGNQVRAGGGTPGTGVAASSSAAVAAVAEKPATIPPAQQTLSVLDADEVLEPWCKWLARTGRVKAAKTRGIYQQYVTEITLQVRD